jgi:hypothetical protein
MGSKPGPKIALARETVARRNLAWRDFIKFCEASANILGFPHPDETPHTDDWYDSWLIFKAGYFQGMERIGRES